MSAVPGFDIWRSCRFVGALMRSLCALPGGIGRFVPCMIGANLCRLRLVESEMCGHGLTSRPSETASEGCLNELLLLFGYPPRSAAALLEGSLPLRYCDGWRLPAHGHAADLVTEVGEDVGVLRVERGASAFVPEFGGSNGVDRISGPDGGVKKSPTKQKNSCAPRKAWYLGDSVSATCLEDTEGSGAFRSVSC